MVPTRSAYIASTTRSPFALNVALTLPELRTAALNNDHLPKDIWFSQYQGKPILEEALLLVRRSLDADQIEHLFRTETRSRVITEALKSQNEVPLAQLDILLGTKGLTAPLIEKIAEAAGSSLDVNWLREAVRKAPKAQLLYFLHAGCTATDEEIGEALADYKSWGPDYKNREIAEILANRPGVLPYAARSNSLWVKTAAAGCRHLTDPALQREVADLDTFHVGISWDWARQRQFLWAALAANPTSDFGVVAELDAPLALLGEHELRERAQSRHTKRPFRLSGPLESETDERVLDWVALRTLPSEGVDGQGVRFRSQDLLALLTNQHLTAGVVRRIASRLGKYSMWLGLPGVDAAVADLAERWPEVFADANWNAERLADLTSPDIPATPETPQTVERDVYMSEYWDWRHEHNLKFEATAEVNDGYYRKVRDGLIPFATAAYDALERQVGVLSETVPESVEAWHMVFQMADSNFAGTTADLAMVANTVAT